VRDWLESLNLGQYADVFEDNEIDMSLLSQVDDQLLKDIGVTIAGHRLRLKSAIASIAAAPEDDSVGQGKKQPSATSPALEGERRQLTVLFCDMVGFTKLASRLDPEILQNIIRVYEDTCAASVTRYEGYVFQRLGDGIVAFFGFPLAHEGEAERAIHAGLDIIDALAKLDVPDAGHLAVRIGIATGVVVVSSAEKGAVGETMNLASRLQGIAQVNSIAVSEQVQRLAGGSFDYEDLGEQSLKGIPRPTHAYRILGASRAASRFEAAHSEGLKPLVGREQELGLLMERWQQAQDDEGQMVQLSGEPGIGKSRILSALRERLEGQEGAQVLHYQCSPYYVNSAFWPITDNLERALKFARDESTESKLDKLEALIVGHYDLPLSDVRFIASMLSIPCDERYGVITMTREKHKDETLRTLVDISEAAAKKQPSVVLFEDAHWADPTTLEVLDLLIDRVRDIPLLIVLTHRPEFQHRWSGHGHVIGLNLSKLTRAQSSALVNRVADNKALPPDLLEKILARTDGVPLFVEELTKSILESGELKGAGDYYEYTGESRETTIPATLRDSLMARLDRYLPVKEVAQIGAAIGREFSYGLIAAVSPMPKEQLDDALVQLTESGLAFRRGTPPGAKYIFKHALVQDAAYDSLLKSRRQELHGKIARNIELSFPASRDTEPEVLARHLTAAGETGAAVPLWRKAGELAQRHTAMTEAIAHFDRGLELVATLPPSKERDASELELRGSLGLSWTMLKGWAAPEVWNTLNPALALAKSLERYDAFVNISGSLIGNIQTCGRPAEALSWAKELLKFAVSSGDVDQQITGLGQVCGSCFWVGRLVEALEYGTKVMALYDAEKNRDPAGSVMWDRRTGVGVYSSLATWMLGYPDRAVRLSDEKDSDARRRGHAFDLGWALTDGAGAFDLRCEPEKLRIRAEECERVGRKNSLPMLWAQQAPIYFGIAHIRNGNPAEGIDRLKAGVDVWDASGGKLQSPYYKGVLAEGMALVGDLDDALRLIDEQIEQVERPGWEERVYYAEILRLKGWMLSLKGEFEGAEKNYLASLDWAREQQAKSWELRTSTSLARLWQEQGQRKEAHDLLAPVYDWFTEGFDTKDLKEAKALLEELEA
jgi:class 3 adenylate cyclase